MHELSLNSVFPSPFKDLALSFYLRYPNPYAKHVVYTDVLSQRIDPETNKVHTTRLILKRGQLPKWAPKNILQRTESWVLEESVLDPGTMDGTSSSSLLVRTRNLDHRRVMDVTETQAFLPGHEEHGAPVTRCITYGKVESSFGFRSLQKRIEGFGISRFQPNVDKAHRGVCVVIEALRDPQARENLLQGGLSHPFARFATPHFSRSDLATATSSHHLPTPQQDTSSGAAASSDEEGEHMSKQSGGGGNGLRAAVINWWKGRATVGNHHKFPLPSSCCA